jgi:glycine C-acetyltransferase
MRSDPLAFLSAELDSLKQQGLYRHLRVLDDEQKPSTSVDHHHVVNLSSNNYLGLTTHPRLRERALEAIARLGVGTGSVRTIAGTMDIHMELERRLAEFKQTEAVVVFQSGFTANAGTVSSILTKDDVVISDELNHASIIDGCRLSRAEIKVFRHKDVDAARQILRSLPAAQRKLLITDGVFSMDGDLGPLPELCALAEEFGCIMMVDDAHASGVFGTNGRGTIDHFGMHGRVDIQVGTLSKAIGALGGYVAGSKALIEFLYHRARPFLFSTSHPPSVAAACIAAIDVPSGQVKVDEEYRPQTLGGVLPLILGVNEEGRFDFDQYSLRPEVKRILDQLAEQLKMAEYDRLDIVGYTDRIGTNDYNRRLSELRAYAVAPYLMSRGVPENKVRYEGRGDKQPLTASGDCKGLAREELITCLQNDRRVEIEASIHRKHATVIQ